MHVAVNALSYAYRRKSVLKQLSFEVNSGEIIGILGVNGAGKSTLFKLLCRMMPLQSGQIQYDGFKWSSEVKKSLGVVFQEPSLDSKLTGRENLMLFSALYAQALVPEQILGVNLDVPVKNLSGGMKRKLELTRVFLHQPKLVLMDEPTTGLDLRAFEEFWENLKSRSQTVILATHKAEEAEKCDRLLVLHEGQIKLSESPQELKKRASEDHIILQVKDTEQALAILSRLDLALSPVIGEEREILVATKEAHLILPRLIEALPSDSVISAEYRKPSLADAFLKVTGVALQ